MGEPHILSASAALPANYVDQETLLAAFRTHWAAQHFNLERLEQLHRAVRVGGRHLALPLQRYLRFVGLLALFGLSLGIWHAVYNPVGGQELAAITGRMSIVGRPQTTMVCPTA